MYNVVKSKSNKYSFFFHITHTTNSPHYTENLPEATNYVPLPSRPVIIKTHTLKSHKKHHNDLNDLVA